MGDYVATTVIFGDDDVEPLLGVTALESVGIEVDPRNQQLKRLPAVRLKRLSRVPAVVTQDAPPVGARKQLIEVALPLDTINKASKREKSIRHGHPSTL